MIKLSSIRVSKMRFFHLLSSLEIQLINRIISSPLPKFYLKSVIMNIYYIDDVIEVLGRLSDWLNIESVFIKYKYKSSKKVLFLENELEKAKRLFYKKVDVLCEVSIDHDPIIV